MRTIMILMALALAACGRADKSDGGSGTPEDAPIQQKGTPQDAPYSMAINTMADLPACDEAHNQQLVYVLETKQFQTCQAGAWTEIKIEAPAPAAPIGPTGQEIINLLSTIELKKTFADILPEVREVLLSDLFTHETLTLESDLCSPDLAGDRYQLLNYSKDGIKFSYAVELRDGRVLSTYLTIDGQPVDHALVACSDR